MNAVSVDSGKPWVVARDERAVALEVVLLKQTWVLPVEPAPVRGGRRGRSAADVRHA